MPKTLQVTAQDTQFDRPMHIEARKGYMGLEVEAYRAGAPGHLTDARCYFEVQDDRPQLVVFPQGYEQPTIIDLRDGSVVQEAREVAE